MKKLLLLPCLLFAINLSARQIVPIPDKLPQLSQEDYDRSVAILKKANARKSKTYGFYIQSALSYDALLQPESNILDFINKAFCEDPEATCRTLLHFDETRWISFEHISRKTLNEISNRCYCREEK